VRPPGSESCAFRQASGRRPRRAERSSRAHA